MKNYLSRNCLQLYVGRIYENQIKVVVSSDYSRSCRKSRLYVNEKQMGIDLENLWKSIKTKKLLSLNASFDEIDYYDDMCDMYETPIASIERGLKKAKISYNDHGSIPKDWSFELEAIFCDMSKNTSIIEFLKASMGSFLTSDIETNFTKELKPFLQKKVKYVTVS